MRQLFFCFFLFFIINTYAQTGPGGIGSSNGSSSLDIWLRDIEQFSDVGTTPSINGSLLQQWNDISGNGNNAIQTINSRKPTYSSTSKNNYPTLEFDGSTDEIRIDYDISPNVRPNVTIIALADHNTATGNRPFSKLFGHDNGGFDRTVGFDNRCAGETFHYFGGGVNCFTSPNANTDFIVNAQYTASNFTGWFDGDLLIDNISNSNGNGESFLTIGGITDRNFGSTFNEFWDGSITEFIVFSRPLTDVEHIIISNYLSAKYNSSLTANNFYDEDENGDFDHKVAGIGQATSSTENHTDSQGTGIVRISTPSNLDNNEYLFWGEDLIDANYNFSAVASPSKRYRIDTKWRVSETGDLGTVNFVVNASDIDLSGTPAGILKLVRSTVSDFSTVVEEYDLTLSGGLYSTTAMFDDNDYFTLEVAPTSDLSLIKTVNNSIPKIGEGVVFRLTVSNNGPQDATNVIVRDILPPTLIYDDTNSNITSGTYNTNTGDWTLSNIPNGETRTIEIAATIISAGIITNTTEVISLDQEDPESNPNSGS